VDVVGVTLAGVTKIKGGKAEAPSGEKIQAMRLARSCVISKTARRKGDTAARWRLIRVMTALA
jgi:hypothetical protein